MSNWIPTAAIEYRPTADANVIALYQKWTMVSDQGEVKFQWRPVPGQRMALPQGPLIGKIENDPQDVPEVVEFDPSD